MSDTKKSRRKQSGKKKVSMATVQAFGEASKAPGPFADFESKPPAQEGGGVASEPDATPVPQAESSVSKPTDPAPAASSEIMPKVTKSAGKQSLEPVRKCSASVYLTESEKIFVDRTAFEFQSTKFPRRSVSFGTIMRAFTQYMIENPDVVETQLESHIESILKEVSDGKVRV